MNIYLDIDGVLLANTNNAANFANDFLELILTRWPDSTYWLTTHYWRGEDTTAQVLKPVLKPDVFKLLSHVKPTTWKELKTEGINFKQPFLWYDDDLMPDEKAVLEHFDALGCFRHINLDRDPNQLMDEIVHLRKL